jgi:hypothetical protein
MKNSGHEASAQFKLVAYLAAAVSESAMAHIISLLIFARWKQIFQS